MNVNDGYEKNEICYSDVVDGNNLWGKISPLGFSVPMLMLQMVFAIGVNHGLHYLCQRIGQPRFVSNILTALVLCPSNFGIISENFDESIVPTKSLTILQTVANLGLTYATFIQALQTNAIPISQTKPKILCLSTLVFICPFFLGCALYFTFQYFVREEPSVLTYNNVVIISIYWGTIITSTEFTTMTPILSKVKLLCTRVGQEALFVGLFNHFCTWCLINVILAISTTPYTHAETKLNATFYILLFMVIYMVFCSTCVKPVMLRLATHVTEGESSRSNFHVNLILFLVLASGLLTDYFGSHFIFGAYMLGSSIPPGYLAETLIEKMEECANGILMPTYFMMMGNKLDISTVILQFKPIWIISLAIATKILCTIVIGTCCNVPLDDSLSLGFLLNSKGLLPLILLNIGEERGLLTTESFSMLFLTILFSTIFVEPIMRYGFKRTLRSDELIYQRSIEKAKFSDTLRIITSIYDPRNIPSIINLLELSNITTLYCATVHVTHLIELVGHASAVVIEHETQDSFLWNLSSKVFFDRARARSSQIIETFEEYMGTHNAISSFKVLSVVSPIDTMHEDICSLAKDKKTNLIILPYHKQQGADGMLEDTNIEFGSVNQRVLDFAPSSVAVLVDRGLRVLSTSTDHSLRRCGWNSDQVQIAMVFVGGPDDREALSYAWRLASHSLVELTLIRFLEGERVMDEIHQLIDSLQWCSGHDEADVIALYEQKENEKRADNEYLREFYEQTANDGSVCYLEYVVNSGEEIVSSLKEMEQDFNLYIIGRGHVRYSLLSVGLVEWNEHKELGLLGNVLVSSNFASNASVLILQQYPGEVNQNNSNSKSSAPEESLNSSNQQV